MNDRQRGFDFIGNTRYEIIFERFDSTQFAHWLIKGFVLLPCGDKAENEGDDDPISRDPEDVLRRNVLDRNIDILDHRLPLLIQPYA